MLGAPALAFLGRDATSGETPPLMLASVYRAGIDFSRYAASEKYDGIRGYWDGRRLWTRGGEPVHAPTWFTEHWPAVPMDGELWAGRGKFAHAVSTARRTAPDDAAWRHMAFMVFDLPAEPAHFGKRLAKLTPLIAAVPGASLAAVKHVTIASHEDLVRYMNSIVRDGGEGVVLHRLDSPYRTGRSADLLKFKPAEDGDARVVAHVPGRGKYEGLMGALLVETPDGLRFKIGTGFDDATRRDPPPVGAWISYRYKGENDSGIPRFASYLRMRPDL